MEYEKESGILLHPTSLPGAYGLGEIGPEARRFIDRLAEMGQRYWQILPLGPTGYGNSPYQSLSSHAGNHLWISLEDVRDMGLLSDTELAEFPVFEPGPVIFGGVIPARTQLLKTAARRFSGTVSRGELEAFDAFCVEHADWLPDYALFIALKEEHDLRPWPDWDEALALRDSAALAEAKNRHAAAMHDLMVMQYLFHRQWRALVDYAHARSIQIIGDLPIFVAHDSCDVWMNRELFDLDERGRPYKVAGVPPDYFCEDGQLWGNPLYRWDLHRATGYAWWISRIKKTLLEVDLIRIDHFRGFVGYWEVPADQATARHGRWVDGPGADFFERMREALGGLPFIAEDLGLITDDVDALRDRFELPGMRVLQFSFDEKTLAKCDPRNFPMRCVVYTGTHDNDTLIGWFTAEPGGNDTRSQEEMDAERYRIRDYVPTDGSEIHWDLMKLAQESPARICIVPLQDIIGLGSEGRMNVPGREYGNWDWRFTSEQLKAEDIERFRRLTLASGRAVEPATVP